MDDVRAILRRRCHGNAARTGDQPSSWRTRAVQRWGGRKLRLRGRARRSDQESAVRQKPRWPRRMSHGCRRLPERLGRAVRARHEHELGAERGRRDILRSSASLQHGSPVVGVQEFTAALSLDLRATGCGNPLCRAAAGVQDRARDVTTVARARERGRAREQRRQRDAGRDEQGKESGSKDAHPSAIYSTCRVAGAMCPVECPM
jgi:hypothetical protein